jgi:hypothetical protein
LLRTYKLAYPPSHQPMIPSLQNISPLFVATAIAKVSYSRQSRRPRGTSSAVPSFWALHGTLSAACSKTKGIIWELLDLGRSMEGPLGLGLRMIAVFYRHCARLLALRVVLGNRVKDHWSFYGSAARLSMREIKWSDLIELWSWMGATDVGRSGEQRALHKN